MVWRKFESDKSYVWYIRLCFGLSAFLYLWFLVFSCSVLCFKLNVNLKRLNNIRKIRQYNQSCAIWFCSPFIQTILLKYKNRVIKTCFQRSFKFITKNIIFKEKKDIYKEKSGTVTKVKKEKLRSIISFILELCY